MDFNDVLSRIQPLEKMKSKAQHAICVAVDTKHSQFDFYSMRNWDKSTIEHTTKSYRSRLYSAEQMTELQSAVGDFVASYGSTEDTFVTLLLPNNAVSMNTVNIPNMSRRRNEGSLDAVVDAMYKNRSELKIKSTIATQNKQVTTYSLTVASDKLLKAFFNAMQDGGLKPDAITFSSNGLCNAVSALCPHMKSSSYLILDIKHHYARFAFVAKGRTTGFYELPFGYSILRKNKVFPEEMLFDHSIGELAVLNAREKAKAKQLTMMREENVDEEASEETKLDAMFGEDENATTDPTNAANHVQTIKSLPKKEPRKLPKFMVRPTPHDDEGFGCENFRLFEKWALNLIQSNDKLTSQGAPEKIYVNMPADLAYIFDKVNEEIGENGIEFAPLDIRGDKDDITEYLELYGGLYAGQYNRSNNFNL